ncbi:MAG: ATPase domain-containing protein [Rubricoccaceae bacterium]|nr:ATPase domain-containing protein [Rubricoccaceae bacterium]
MITPEPNLTPSGIALIDSSWGGLYRGGTYLLVGHARAGRTRYALATVRAAVDAGESCLLISSRDQNVLIKHANEVGLDLVEAARQKLVQLMSAPSPEELAKLGDDSLVQTLVDLTNLAKLQSASRVVVDNFTPFVQFKSFQRFAKAFSGLTKRAADLNATIVLGLGEPANPASRRLLEFLGDEVTGTMRLGLTPDIKANLSPGTAHHVADSSLEGEEKASFEAVSIENGPWEKGSGEDAATDTDQDSLPFELRIPGVDSLPDLDSIMAPVPDPDLPPVGSPVADTFEQPHGDSIWTEIRAVNPSDVPHLPEPEDPFLREHHSDLLSHGHYVDSRGELRAAVDPSGDDPPGLDELADNVHRSAYPELFTVEASESRESKFKRALSSAFASRDTSPFLVFAVRVQPDSPAAKVFSVVRQGIERGVGSEGRLLSAENKLIALMPDTDANAAQHVFSKLRAHLETIIPDHTDLALQHVNAFTAPNGAPFTSADELFAFAFEK